jgi:hypothetical protein
MAGFVFLIFLLETVGATLLVEVKRGRLAEVLSLNLLEAPNRLCSRLDLSEFSVCNHHSITIFFLYTFSNNREPCVSAHFSSRRSP